MIEEGALYFILYFNLSCFSVCIYIVDRPNRHSQFSESLDRLREKRSREGGREDRRK